MGPKGGSLASEFERLLELDFDGLLSAHSSLLASGATARVRAAVSMAFSST
jgi:hypothetical protein